MANGNKQTLIQYAKVLLIFVLSFVVIIPNIEIWNLASQKLTDGFHVVFSILNLVFGGFCTYALSKKMLKDAAESEESEKSE